MHPENGFAPANVRQIDCYLPVKTSGTQQGWVQHIRPVRGGDDNNAFLGVKAVHFDQQRVEGLFTFIVATPKPVSPAPPDSVNFIDENQTGRILARLFEHVAHPAGADADKHFHEIGPADAEKRGVRLAGDGLGEQRFPRAGGTHHQYALGDSPAELLEFFGVLQKLDEFGDFLFGLLHTRHVFERRAVLFLAQHPRLALAEAQRSFAGHFELADQEKPNQRAEKHERQQRIKDPQQQRIGFLRFELACAQ